MSEALPELVGRAGRRVVRGLVAANSVGGVVVYVYRQFLAPGAFTPRAGLRNGVISLIVFIVYATSAIALSTRRLPLTGRRKGA
jgi:hypothetical protein